MNPPPQTDLFPTEAFAAVAVTAPPVRLSRKQAQIVAHCQAAGEITLATAVSLVGRDIYANAAKHVGALLANMVRRGLLVRPRPGCFRLPPA